ncbi:hypothetical protein KIPB_013290, partial [Kipferlia bialata]
LIDAVHAELLKDRERRESGQGETVLLIEGLYPHLSLQQTDDASLRPSVIVHLTIDRDTMLQRRANRDPWIRDNLDYFHNCIAQYKPHLDMVPGLSTSLSDSYTTATDNPHPVQYTEIDSGGYTETELTERLVGIVLRHTADGSESSGVHSNI